MTEILGTSRADVIDGTINSDVIYGYQGSDSIEGYGGNDTVFGGQNDDFIGGGLGDDFLVGGQGDDTILGDEGNDRLFGGKGNDNLSGSSGNDLMYGDSGNDILYGVDAYSSNPGAGEIDTLVGGTGRDTFSLGVGGSLAEDLVSNTFYKSAGNADFALIVDFEIGLDKILVSGKDTYKLADLSIPGFGSGVGVLLTTGGQNELIGFLPGVSSNQLSLTRDFRSSF